MNNTDTIIEEFEKHLKKSVPVLDRFETASILNKLRSALSTQRKELEEEKKVNPLNIDVSNLKMSKVQLDEFMEKLIFSLRTKSECPFCGHKQKTQMIIATKKNYQSFEHCAKCKKDFNIIIKKKLSMAQL